jgi:hypothetical protein
MKEVAELAAAIIRKNLTLSEAASHVGCPPEELFGWILGATEPSPSFRKILPAVVIDIGLLYPDVVERKN